MLTAANLAAIQEVRHGFFTRQGGVSEGALASLNCGYSGGDAPEAVAANRARAMARIGVRPLDLCTVKQVHGKAVHVAGAPDPGPSSVEADALVTDRPGLAIGVLSADCAPVLAVDPEAGVIGAAHAGWRGALAGVIEAMVEAMTGLGARPHRITAAIGACIARPSYEVGPDMLAAFERHDPKGTAWFTPLAGGDRLLFDLKAYGLERLARAGVPNPVALQHDTLADEARFFSARRSRNRGEQRFGLLLSAIALLP
jgi:YfiH family protein